jgi:HK97 gp10 family phage protein
MSAGLSLQGYGFDELAAKLDRMGPTIQKEAGRLVLDGARRAEQIAKRLAPADNGTLRNLILASKDGEYGATLESLADYSAYQEWGTGSRVIIATDPQERAYEETFKTGKETVGHYGKPFFFPAFYEVVPTIVADVEAMLQEEADK